MKNKKQKLIVKFLKQNSAKFAAIVAITTYCIFSADISLGATFDDQVGKVNTLINGKFKTFVVTGGTIGGTAMCLFRGNLAQAGMVFFVGVLLGFYLEWVKEGMVVAAMCLGIA
jgi:hypothetical protein